MSNILDFHENYKPLEKLTLILDYDHLYKKDEVTGRRIDKNIQQIQYPGHNTLHTPIFHYI